MRGATQNANECLNGMIWKRCPKETFCDAFTAETAACLAIAEFNHGGTTINSVLQEMGCTPGDHVMHGLASCDKERMYHSGRKTSPAVKKARKVKRATKKGYADAQKEAEGHTYRSGMF